MKKKEYLKPDIILYKVELESFIAESPVNPEMDSDTTLDGPISIEDNSEDETCAKKHNFSLWDEW